MDFKRCINCGFSGSFPGPFCNSCDRKPLSLDYDLFAQEYAERNMPKNHGMLPGPFAGHRAHGKKKGMVLNYAQAERMRALKRAHPAMSLRQLGIAFRVRPDVAGQIIRNRTFTKP